MSKITVDRDGFEPVEVEIWIGSFGDVYCIANNHMTDSVIVGKADPKPKTYSIGQRFKFNDGNDYAEYMLAATSSSEVILTNTSLGNRWCNPTRVRNPAKITVEELKSMLGDQFLFFAEVPK